MAINGNDLNGVQGSSSSCCQLCQQKRGCLAYTWDNFNGGTCWLKSDTQPLYSKNGSISGLMLPDLTNTYSLNKTYSGPNFFDDWIFEGGGGSVADRVNESLARDLGIIGYQNNSVGRLLYFNFFFRSILPWITRMLSQTTLGGVVQQFGFNRSIFITLGCLFLT